MCKSSKKKRAPKKPRSLVTLGMILTRKAKSWDPRDRRSKDARRRREEME